MNSTLTAGVPYEELVSCWEYVDKNLDYVDTDNGIAAGGSYGGFMANWIQGKELGRKFKALVTHDGTFVAAAGIYADELWYMEHDVRQLPSYLTKQKPTEYINTDLCS